MAKGKKKVAAPAAKKAAPAAAAASSVFQPRKRSFGIGGDVQPKRDVGRFVKWPKYIRLQRQKRVLVQRLKVPPSINMFTNTANKNSATEIFKLLNKYRPEDKAAKRERLKAAAANKAAADKDAAGPKPMFVKYGLNHVVALVEQKKAQLVVIAHDVDPIELVVFLPALCRKMDVPFAIIKGKARLGQVVHKKTATCLALTNVRVEDKPALTRVIENVRANFNDRFDEIAKRWGTKTMGAKTQIAVARAEKAKAKEALAKYA